jgi:hypothetical protein
VASCVSLLQHLHKQAQIAWNGISMEQLLEELPTNDMLYVLLYSGYLISFPLNK